MVGVKVHQGNRTALMDEQKRILGEQLEHPMDYEALKEMSLLDACVKETLRLKPPILTLIRKVGCRGWNAALTHRMAQGHGARRIPRL